jgi:epoxyqueuosine reductase
MGLTAPRLRNLANLDDQNFRNLFSRSAIKRLGRERFVRNVLIAIGNSGDKTFIPTLLHRLSDKSSLIRAMAVWALSELMSEVEFSQLKDTQADNEKDPDVQHEWSVNDPECC